MMANINYIQTRPISLFQMQKSAEKNNYSSVVAEIQNPELANRSFPSLQPIDNFKNELLEEKERLRSFGFWEFSRI